MQTSRSRSRSRVLAFVAVGGLTFALSVGVRAEDADTLYREGSTALQGGDAKTAYDKLSKAFALKQSVDIAGNLAMSELKLGKSADAATHLEYALRTYPATGDSARKERIQALLDETKKSVAEVSIAVDIGTTIKVDGRVVGLAPLPAPVFVQPGGHRIEATGASGRAERTLELKAGAEQTVVLVLAESVTSSSASASGAPSSSAPVPTASASAAPADSGRPAWPAIVLGSVAAVGVGVGVGATVAGVGATSDVDGSPCPGLEQTCSSTIVDAVDQRNMLIGVGVAGFAVGGAALGAMIAYLVWPEPDAAPTAGQLRFLPTAGTDGVGLSFGGRF
jgi:hypothetical protein